MTNLNRRGLPVLLTPGGLFLVVAELELVAALSGCASGVVHFPPSATTAVIVPRHADIDGGEDALNAKCEQCAEVLVEALRDHRITAI